MTSRELGRGVPKERFLAVAASQVEDYLLLFRRVRVLWLRSDTSTGAVVTCSGLVAEHRRRGRHGARVCVGEASQELLRDNDAVIRVLVEPPPLPTFPVVAMVRVLDVIVVNVFVLHNSD